MLVRAIPFRLILPVALLGLTASCASIPQEAVVLSNMVGTQIAEHRASHEQFVRLYFARSRDMVEMFLRDRWVPEYLERFVDQSGVIDLLTTPDEVFEEDDLDRLREELMAVSGVGEMTTPLIIDAVARAFGGAERGQIMLDFAQVALGEIEGQRAELIDPLNQQEMEVLDYLSESYAQLQQAQAQVTAFIASGQEVTKSQDEVLEMMGIREVRDDAVDHAVWLSDKLTEATKAGGTAAEALEQIKELIGSGGPTGLED